MAVFTFGDIATAFARLDNLDEEGRDALLRQLRNWHSKGLLTPIATADGRGTQLFDPVEVYRARVFSALRFVVDVSILREVDRAMRDHPTSLKSAPSTKFDGGQHSRGALVDAVHGVAQGEEWTLHIESRIFWLAGLKPVSARIAWDGCADPEGDAKASEILDTLSARRGEFNASVALAPLFANLPSLDA